MGFHVEIYEPVISRMGIEGYITENVECKHFIWLGRATRDCQKKHLNEYLVDAGRP